MNGFKLRELLRALDPATSIEIAQWYNGKRIYYCGILLNLTYCNIEKVMEQQVCRIRMKNEEHGYRVLIEIY